MHPLQSFRQKKNSGQNPWILYGWAKGTKCILYNLDRKRILDKAPTDWILQSMDGQKEQKATKPIIADRPKNDQERY
jgi:hypothetical protein